MPASTDDLDPLGDDETTVNPREDSLEEDTHVPTTGELERQEQRVFPESPPPEIPGYRIVEKIDEGGMGAIYHAEREGEVPIPVALKVLKAVRDDQKEERVLRFRLERQALARMEHPNIARIVDSGSTPSGEPYFAMELVKGKPLTDYCDANKLHVRSRLELFATVCDAIQHVHSRSLLSRIEPAQRFIPRPTCPSRRG